jgi:hypothetical protein
MITAKPSRLGQLELPEYLDAAYMGRLEQALSFVALQVRCRAPDLHDGSSYELMPHLFCKGLTCL